MNKVIIVFCCLMVSIAYGTTYLFDENGFKKYGPPKIPLLEAVQKAKTVFPEGEVVECISASASPANPERGDGGWSIICSTTNVYKWLVVKEDRVTVICDNAEGTGITPTIPQFTLNEAVKLLSEQTDGVPVIASGGGDSWSFTVLSGTNITEFVVSPREGIFEREWRNVFSTLRVRRFPDKEFDFTKLSHGGHTLAEWLNILSNGIPVEVYNFRQLFSLSPTNDTSSLPIVVALATNNTLSLSMRSELLMAVLAENNRQRGTMDFVPFIPLLDVLLTDEGTGSETFERKRLAFRAVANMSASEALLLTNAVIRAAQLAGQSRLQERVDDYFSKMKKVLSAEEWHALRKQARPIEKANQ